VEIEKNIILNSTLRMDQENESTSVSMIRLNCRGKYITIPRDVAERFFPVIRASKNFDSTSGEYFINHRVSHVHDLLDSLEIPLKHEMGIFEPEKKEYIYYNIVILETERINYLYRRKVVINNREDQDFYICKYNDHTAKLHSVPRNNYVSPFIKLCGKELIFPIVSRVDNVIQLYNKKEVMKTIVDILNE